MSVKKLKAGIRAWLESIVRIDAWDLDTPKNVPTVLQGKRYPANCAIDLPVKSLKLRQSNMGQLQGSGHFIYILLYRFSGKASKMQLPVGSVESLVNYLLERAVAYPQEIYEDIIKLEVQSIADPVSLARVEGEDQDWLIVARLELEIAFLSDAESDFTNLQPVGPDDAPIEVTQINLGLNRATFPATPDDPTTYIFDRLIEIPLNEAP